MVTFDRPSIGPRSALSRLLGCLSSSIRHPLFRYRLRPLRRHSSLSAPPPYSRSLPPVRMCLTRPDRTGQNKTTLDSAVGLQPFWSLLVSHSSLQLQLFSGSASMDKEGADCPGIRRTIKSISGTVRNASCSSERLLTGPASSFIFFAVLPSFRLDVGRLPIRIR